MVNDNLFIENQSIVWRVALLRTALLKTVLLGMVLLGITLLRAALLRHFLVPGLALLILLPLSFVFLLVLIGILQEIMQLWRAVLIVGTSLPVH